MNMPSMAKCPKCEKVVGRVTAGHVEVYVPAGETWHGISYSCPHCHTVLSVQIDPIALKNDIVNELFSRLRE